MSSTRSKTEWFHSDHLNERAYCCDNDCNAVQGGLWVLRSQGALLSKLLFCLYQVAAILNNLYVVKNCEVWETFHSKWRHRSQTSLNLSAQYQNSKRPPCEAIFDVRAPCVRYETIQMKATEQYFLWCNLFCCTMWFCFIQKCDHSKQKVLIRS